ncbi:hypothetical protein EG833_04510, partial [archaeon]|nr:hypothetical protein [archaeon]
MSNKFLKSRFAYRIFILFVCCAVVPLVVLAYVSFYQVSSQLRNNAQERLHNQATSLGMSILERFVFAAAEIDITYSYYMNGQDTGLKTLPAGLKDYFAALAIITDEDSSVQNLTGSRKNWPILSRKQRDLLSEGKTLVFTASDTGTSASIFMYKNRKDRTGKGCKFLAQIRPHYLLGVYHGEEETFGTV